MINTADDEKILDSVKLILGGNLVSYNDDAFNQQILLHINSVFTILNQLGVGPRELFVANKDSTWDQFLVGDSTSLNLVKSYMYLKVRLLFDPPSSSFITEAIKDQIKEYEWRLNIQVETEGDNQNV